MSAEQAKLTQLSLEPGAGVVVRPEPDDGRRWFRHPAPAGYTAWCRSDVPSPCSERDRPRGDHAPWSEVLDEAGGVVVEVSPDGPAPGGETWPPDELVEQATQAAHDTFKTEPVLVRPGHNPWSAVARAALSCPAVAEYVEGLRRDSEVTLARAAQNGMRLRVALGLDEEAVPFEDLVEAASRLRREAGLTEQQLRRETERRIVAENRLDREVGKLGNVIGELRRERDELASGSEIWELRGKLLAALQEVKRLEGERDELREELDKVSGGWQERIESRRELQEERDAALDRLAAAETACDKARRDRDELREEIWQLRRTFVNAEYRTGRWFRALNEIRALCDDAQRVAPAGQQMGQLLDETGAAPTEPTAALEREPDAPTQVGDDDAAARELWSLLHNGKPFRGDAETLRYYRQVAALWAAKLGSQTGPRVMNDLSSGDEGGQKYGITAAATDQRGAAAPELRGRIAAAICEALGHYAHMKVAGIPREECNGGMFADAVMAVLADAGLVKREEADR